jgi:NAD(P)H-flavin reductase
LASSHTSRHNNPLLPDLQKVVKKLAEEGSITVRADGPYGRASEPEWSSYDTICMIAGGIGVSPSSLHL